MSTTTLFLTDADVRAAFEWGAATLALKAAYSAPTDDALFPPRSMARGDGIWLRTLTGIVPGGGVMGAKMIAASPRTGRASYLIPLFDQETMELTALLDGNSITGFRTAATSALAVDLLAVPGPITVGVIGSGFEAVNHVRALAPLRPLARVTVFSPNPASRRRFIDALADLDVEVLDADSAQLAVEGADVIICAARSRDESPTLVGDWVTSGATIVSIGSTLPEQRELDTGVVEMADLIVADMVEEVAHDTGDMLACTTDGVAFVDKLVSLSEVASGAQPGRNSADQIIIYKSVGAAMQDIVVSALCAERARAMGIGAALPVSITPVTKGK